MKFIQKGKEPEAWKTYRLTEGVVFAAIPELKNALLAEQGYLCCYCMQRINFDTMKVEHWRPRRYKDFIFAYNKLMAACEGNFCTDKHCDTLKDDDEISINPTYAINNVENIISYKWSDGSLEYLQQYEEDVITFLNLNNTVLKRNRLSVLNAVIQVLKLKNYSKSECQKQLDKFQKRDKTGKFQPYCMVAVRFLEKKLKQYK